MSYMHETSLYHHQHPRSAMALTDMNLQFFSDDFISPFTDSSIDSFEQTFSDNSSQLQNLCINQSQTTHLKPLAEGYSDAQNVTEFMQRSYSSSAFDLQTEFCFKPQFNTLKEIEPSKSRNLNISSPEGHFFIERMRKVSSTGDLQNMKPNYVTQRSFSSSSASERLFAEEQSFKVERYSAAEKKEKILKYRAKRSQRNFNKTIKYACRKTLADTRPRIRGRFARNDEVAEIPMAACSSSDSRNEDEYQLWLNELHGQREDGTGRGHFVNSYGIAQYQQYGY